MNTYVPYFYIIQDRRNGMYYVGSKYSKKKSQRTNPKYFMTEGGYHTSSNVIKTIIKLHGLETFVIRKIKTFQTAEETKSYETRFLRKVNARNNKRFYNKHNNDGYFENDNTELMMEIYGVDNFSKSELFPERFRVTCLEKYGVEHHLQNPEIMEKHKKTCMERYGVDNVAKSEQAKKNYENTMLEKYGVTSYAKTKEFKERMKEHNMERLGVDHYGRSDEGRKKLSNLQKNRFERPLVKEIQELILIAKDLEIDYSGKFGLTRLWWQRTDDNLLPIKEALSKEIDERKASGARKRTKREKMQELNKKLYSRPIVSKISGIAMENGVKLKSAWWRKSDDALQELLEELHTMDD